MHLEEPVVVQLSKEFPAFYENRRFITLFVQEPASFIIQTPENIWSEKRVVTWTCIHSPAYKYGSEGSALRFIDKNLEHENVYDASRKCLF